jgi:hypothetical protein
MQSEIPTPATLFFRISASNPTPGFSFSDAYLNEIRSEVVSMLDDKSFLRPPIGYGVFPDMPASTKAFFLEQEGMDIMTWDTKVDGFKHVDVLLEEIVKRVESLDEVHGDDGDTRSRSPAHGGGPSSTSTDAGESFSRMRRRSTTSSAKLDKLL